VAVGGEPVWLGADVGTSGVRVLAVDGSGHLLSAGSAPVASAFPEPGRHEQDPADWISALASASRQAVARIPGRPIGAIAICATSGTILVTDDGGRPLGPALMYDDARARGTRRTAELVHAWSGCSERNGYQVQPTWALARLGWLVDHVDSARSGRLRHCADHLGSWLVGAPVAADASHALKTGYDLVRDRWPEEELAAVGIPLAMLPDVVRPGTTLGTVGREASEATGLPVGVPVVAGMTDGCASQIAAGTVRQGQVNLALGTTFVLKAVSGDLLHGDALYSHRHPDGGWLPGGASSSGAGVLRAEFPDADLAALDRAAADRLPTPLLSYPLARPGERFPFVRPDAEPIRLGEPRDEGERFAALLQGVAFVERLALAYLRSLGGRDDGPVAITGGATASARWTQLRADILGRPLRVPAHPDAAFGMAVVAASADQKLADVADRMVSVRETIEPRAHWLGRFDDAFGAFVGELRTRGWIDEHLAEAACAA
jgi:sugar (pentulose or hexulose) kinase